MDFARLEDATKFFDNNSAKSKGKEQRGNNSLFCSFVTLISVEPMQTLDDLFRKTIAKPPLYYLPLSEEQVEQKKKAAAEAKATKEEAKWQTNLRTHCIMKDVTTECEGIVNHRLENAIWMDIDRPLTRNGDKIRSCNLQSHCELRDLTQWSTAVWLNQWCWVCDLRCTHRSSDSGSWEKVFLVGRVRLILKYKRRKGTGVLYTIVFDHFCPKDRHFTVPEKDTVVFTR